MDGAVPEAVHNSLVTSPRLRAGQWPDPKGEVWTGTQRCRCVGTLVSPAVTSPQAGSSCRVPEPFRLLLP